MRCTAVLGNLNDPSYEIVLRRELGGAFETDELMLDGDEAAGVPLRRMSARGRLVEIDRAGATDPLLDGDVLGVDRAGGMPVVIVARLRVADVLMVEADRLDPVALARACWEIGNMHAPLFEGQSDERIARVVTPAMPGLEHMLGGIPGVRIERKRAALDQSRRFTSGATEAVVGLSADFRIVKK